MQSINQTDKNVNQAQLEKKIMIEEEEMRKKLVSQIEMEFQANKKENQDAMKKQIEEKEKEYHNRIRDMERMREEETARLQR